jgi:glycosyltransferase involved in cell wall biosynthesis
MTKSLVGPRVLALTETPPSGCTLWRIFTVFERLEQARYMAHHAPLKDHRVANIAANYEAIILPRTSWAFHERDLAERWFDTIHRAGIAVIYETDDDLFSPAIIDRMHDTHWEEGKSNEQLEQDRQDRIWSMQHCDGVTVTTQRLATIVRQFTDRPVLVVPNYIDLRWFREVIFPVRRSIPGLTIGWAGGRRAEYDVEPMAEAWGHIARRYPDVTFVCQGYQPTAITENVPPERLVRLPWMPLERYPVGLRQIDIGCAPVADVPFNRSKSNIKALEYAVAGSAVVASPLLYAGVVDHGYSGFIANDIGEWIDGLSQLIERPALRAMMAKRLLKTVERTWSLDANLWRWPAAWSEIVADYRARQHPRLLVPVGVTSTVLSGVA